MKIIYVIPSLTTGGAELQTIYQVNYLYQKGHECDLFILSNRLDNLSMLSLPKKRIHILKKNSYETLGKGFLRKVPMMVRFMAKHVPIAVPVHVLLVLEESHLIGRLLKILRPSLSIHMYYRDIHFTSNTTLSLKIFDRINDLLSRWLDDSSLFISDAVEKDIKNKFHTIHTLTLPNSLPVLMVDDKAGKTLLEAKSIHHDFTILLPGRFHFKKGHLGFLQEFKNFCMSQKLDHNDVGLLLAGDGPEREKIEALIQTLDLKGYVTILGLQSHERLLSLYKCSNLVVIPSLREGFGNVAIEGLMQGSWMLVSNIDGLAEIISDGYNGFTFNVFSQGEGERKLSFIYEQRHTELLDRELLHESFLKKYTIEAQINTILDHLRSFEKT